MHEEQKHSLPWIRRILGISGSEDDRDERAFAINIVSLSGLALSLTINGILIIQAIFTGGQYMATDVTILVVSVVVLATAYGLSRRGKVDAASHILMWGTVFFALLGSLPDPGSGPTDPVWYLLALPVVGANLLLGTRWSITFVIIGTLLYTTSPQIKEAYFAAAQSPSPTPYENAMLGGILTTLAIFVWLFRSGMEKALHRSQRQAAELERYQHTLEQRMAAEQEQRKHLQDAVETYVSHMAEVAQGRLDVRIPVSENGHGAEDPLITLGQNLNDTITSLQQMTLQIHNAADNLNAASVEILAATTQQASGASEQSAAIAQTTTTVDQLRAITEQAVIRAQEVADASKRTAEVSYTGQLAVSDTVNSVHGIKSRVEGIAENILKLAEQMQQIGEITATVDDIAAQSNILALNASVEAARAGEHGKGFAVVAMEVRNLAEQSRQATAQVRAILSDIQKATNATVMATEEGAKGADEGMQLATQAGEAIEHLLAVIAESTQAATQLVAGGQQQVIGVEQIALAMQNINQATAQNLTSTRQTEKASQELSQLARSLMEVVEQYQL